METNSRDSALEILNWTEDGIRWISLNRPRAGNAAHPALMEQLCGALDAAIADPAVSAIVVTGEGRNFLAGGDFGFLHGISDAGGTEASGPIYKWFQGATRRLYGCAKPTLAAISGGAITVGCEIALACDVRLIDRTAFFQESWLDLGLIPPLGGAMLLPHTVGLSLAKEMILEGRRVDADEALRTGLANAVFEDIETLREGTQQRAKALAAKPHEAFRLAKELIHRGLESTMAQEWSAGVMAQSLLLGSDGFREALAAKVPKPKA